MDRARIEKISKALADETRLFIFESIGAHPELTCSQIVDLKGVTPATVSHHLKILAEADLISCERKGQFVFSRINPRTIGEYTKALAALVPGTRK
jgi:ArsR family transcriptional regulator